MNCDVTKEKLVDNIKICGQTIIANTELVRHDLY